MHEIRLSTAFRRDVKAAKKRRRNMEKLKTVMSLLAEGKPLPEKNRDHKLTGNWKNHRECHIEPDWLLIYRIYNDALEFVRTGSHAELFGM